MSWGSTWGIATHAGINVLCLCPCPKDVDENPGGQQFKPPDAHTNGVNPLLGVGRIMRPAAVESHLSPTLRTSNYGTVNRLAPRGVMTTGLPRRLRGDSDAALHQALRTRFQRHLAYEEQEFMLLLIAATEENCCD